MASKTSKYGKALLLGLITASMGVLLALTPAGFWTSEELSDKLSEELTWLFKIRGAVKAPPDVALVLINQQDAHQLGQTEEIKEWPRNLHARLIDQLSRRGVSVIVLDIAFLKPRPSASEDETLAAAIERAGRVVLLQTIERESIAGNRILRDRLDGPIPKLADAAKGLGPWPIPKKPARVCRFWAFKDVGGETPTLPAIALQVHALNVLESFLALLKQTGLRRDGIPRNAAEIANAEDLLQFMRLLRVEFRKNPQMTPRLLKILTDSGIKSVSDPNNSRLVALAKLYGGEDSYYLNFYGPPATIETLSYRDILAGNNLQFDLKGKAVFVGALESSKAMPMDGYDTVFSREDGTDLSGVEIAATAYANLLTGRTLQLHMPVNLGILMLFGFLAGALACSASGMRAFVSTLSIGILYFIVARFLFIRCTLWIPVFIPILFQLPAALFLGLFCRYRYAKNERERLIAWVPDKIASPPDTGRAFGVCLLTDIRGSRAISSRLSAAEYSSLMEEYYKKITPPVKRRGGRVWDFSGDGMMCLFAARHAEPALQQHACLAALEILDEVELFNRQLNSEQQLPTGIGLHSGWLELGGKTLGDIGNTSASIEGLNRQLRTKALVSQTVVEGFIKFPANISVLKTAEGGNIPLLLRRLGAFSLPGKSAPLSIFELLNFRKDPADNNLKLCELYAAALAAFEEKRWLESADMFQEIIAVFPGDLPSHCMLFSCREYYRNPPQTGAPAIVRIGEFIEGQGYAKESPSFGII